MACFYPLPATQLPGGEIIVHKRTPGIPRPISKIGRDLKLPCSNCLGCRLDRSKQWSVRLMHEAQQHERNSFLTLTYNDQTLSAYGNIGSAEAAAADVADASVEDLPPVDDDPSLAIFGKPSSHEASLRPRDLQLFIKRLRQHLTTRNPSTRIRFYGVGEYGELTMQPHYHVALFGEDFSDDRIYWRTSGDYKCYRSSRLEQLWPHGNSEIGELTTDSAAYIARYVMKKINGKMADEHYRRETPEGETYYLQPEFAHMSRRPGIARTWLEQYITDVYPHDHVVVDGRKNKPPRYYDKLLEAWDPVEMTRIKFEREMRTKELEDDNTPARLADKEMVTTAKLNLKKRNLE